VYVTYPVYVWLCRRGRVLATHFGPPVRLLMVTDISTKLHMYMLNGFDTVSKAVLMDAECLSDASCDNFWISCDDLRCGRSLCFIEALICWIHGHVMKEHVGSNFTGVEYWVQVRVMSSSSST
jgi:hypothetical protein